MDDRSVTGSGESRRFTTGTEVAGIPGGFTGSSEGGVRETSTGDARQGVGERMAWSRRRTTAFGRAGKSAAGSTSRSTVVAPEGSG